MQSDLSKYLIFRFLIRFCTKISYFFAIQVSFESTWNWLSAAKKIKTLGRFTAEHLQFKKLIPYREPQIFTLFRSFFTPGKNVYFSKKITSSESPFLPFSDEVIFFLVPLTIVPIQRFKKSEKSVLPLSRAPQRFLRPKSARRSHRSSLR